MEVLIPIALLLVAGGTVLIARRRKAQPVGYIEYWVYVPVPMLPADDEIMDRMLARNPHNGPNGPAIATAEALLFSDVRLHVAVATRERNPHAFRPDLFVDAAPTAEVLSALAASHAMLKVRFVAETPIDDDRYIHFVTHLAAALADAAEGRVIYDVVAERFWLPSELHAALAEDPDARRHAIHVTLHWRRHAEVGTAETRGLRKLGLPELRSDSAAFDQEVLVLELMAQAVEEVWSGRVIPAELAVRDYGDEFRLVFRPGQSGFAAVAIRRYHPTS